MKSDGDPMVPVMATTFAFIGLDHPMSTFYWLHIDKALGSTLIKNFLLYSTIFFNSTDLIHTI